MSTAYAESSSKIKPSQETQLNEDTTVPTSSGSTSTDFHTIEDIELLGGTVTITPLNEQGEVPADVDAISEINDLTVLREQLSSDEVVTGSGILNVEKLINESRLVQDEDEDDYSDYESEVHETTVMTIDVWEILKKGAINLVLPFINGMMLGFGEILAHEIGFKYNWSGAKVEPPRRIEQRRREPSKFL